MACVAPAFSVLKKLRKLMLCGWSEHEATRGARRGGTTKKRSYHVFGVAWVPAMLVPRNEPMPPLLVPSANFSHGRAYFPVAPANIRGSVLSGSKRDPHDRGNHRALQGTNFVVGAAVARPSGAAVSQHRQNGTTQSLDLGA